MVTFHAHITSIFSWQAPGPGAHAMTHQVTLPEAIVDYHVLTFETVRNDSLSCDCLLFACFGLLA